MATAPALSVLGTTLAAGAVAPLEVQSLSTSRVVHPEYPGRRQPFPIQFYLTRSSNVTVAAHNDTGAVVTAIYVDRSLPAGCSTRSGCWSTGRATPHPRGIYSIEITTVDSDGGTSRVSIGVELHAGRLPPLQGLTLDACSPARSTSR